MKRINLIFLSTYLSYMVLSGVGDRNADDIITLDDYQGNKIIIYDHDFMLSRSKRFMTINIIHVMLIKA